MNDPELTHATIVLSFASLAGGFVPRGSPSSSSITQQQLIIRLA